MADQRKKIIIEGDGKAFSSSIDRMKQDVRGLAQEFLKEGRQSKLSGKETLSFLDEQIKSLQRKNKLLFESSKLQEQDKYKNKLSSSKTEEDRTIAKTLFDKRIGSLGTQERERDLEINLLKDISENIKTLAKQEISTDPKAVQKEIREAERLDFQGYDDEQIAKLQYQKDLMAPERESKGEVSNFAQVVGAGLLRDVGDFVKQMPNAQTGIDLLNPAGSLSGMAAGGLVGTGLGAVAGSLQSGTSGTAAGRGAVEGFAVGSELGKQVGQFAATTLTRSLNEQERYLKNYYSVVNLTGLRPGSVNLSSIGISSTEGLEMQNQLIRKAGRSISDSKMRSTLSFRARGIDQSVVNDMLEMERTGGGDASQELSRLIGVLEEIPTINRVLYNDIANNQISLMQNMRTTQDVISGRDAFRTTLAFNNLGGQFGSKNSLAGQNMVSVRGSMTNPVNDSVQARQLSILRDMFPEASYVDLLEKQQNPDSEIMQAFLSDKGLEGLPEEIKALAFSGAYGGGNIAKGRSLAKGLTLPDVDKFADIDALFSEVQIRTPKFEKQKASIEDAFLRGPIEGLDQVRKEFGNTMKFIADKELEKINMEKIIGERFDGAVSTFKGAVEAFKFYWRYGPR